MCRADQQPLLPLQYNLSRTIARRHATLSQHYSFLAAVQADAAITAVHSMVERQDGLPCYIVIGDAVGRLYFFAPDGNLLYEHNSGECCPICLVTSTNTP